jgi:hypothetical protein
VAPHEQGEISTGVGGLKVGRGAGEAHVVIVDLDLRGRNEGRGTPRLIETLVICDILDLWVGTRGGEHMGTCSAMCKELEKALWISARNILVNSSSTNFKLGSMATRCIWTWIAHRNIGSRYQLLATTLEVT